MKEQVSLFVPGRLCLFGEHSDWAGTYTSRNADLLEGQAIVTGINLGIYATAVRSDCFQISSFDINNNPETFTCEMHTKMLKDKAAKPGLFSYCAGVAAYMRENYHVGGVSITVTKVTLPMKKGLSSSAAICCIVAKAFNELYGLNISTRGIMQIAYRGELLTGSRCGRLDQACAYGENPVLMHFDDTEIDVERLKVGKTFHWVIADLCASKDTKKILAYLNKAYPFATEEIGVREQEALGPDNHRVIAKARQAIESGDAESLGRIMKYAQELFDEKVAPACPDELESPVLHSVLNDPYLQPLIYGAKGVGSQGDGTVQLLAKDKECQAKIVDYLNNERKMDAFAFNLNAGGKIKKAIIPVAGIGTRMFPETFFIKKAFLPVIGKDGMTKPVLMYMLEELIDSEIEDIYLIVGEGEEEEYNRFFRFEFDKSYQEKLPKNMKAYYEKIYEMGQKLHFVVQHEKRGFGHAVYQAREFLKGEPAILMLGDFVYKSNLDISCTQQTINAYNKSGGKSVVSIKRIPFSESKNYGIIHGKFTEERNYIMNVDNMVEKPDEITARESLSVDGECYATFGQYVLTDDVFAYLENQIDDQTIQIEQGLPTKEIDITSALLNEAKKGELAGVDVDGESFDVGIPEMYYRTFVEYRN